MGHKQNTPWISAIIVTLILLGPGALVTGSVRAMVGLVVGGIAQSAIVCLSTVIASHAFMFLAARVKSTAAR